jgi:hypothetical protein
MPADRKELKDETSAPMEQIGLAKIWKETPE